MINIHGDPQTQMAFNWFSHVDDLCGMVEIFLGADKVQTVNAICIPHAGSIENKAVAKELIPNTTYSFRVGNPDKWSTTGTFTTAKESKGAFTFIYTTDQQAATPAQFEISSITSHTAFANHPDAKFWLSCGDVVENSYEDEWKQFFETQQDLFLNIPFAPVRGNHDGTANFRTHFNTENFRNTDLSGSTYTFNFGDAQFFALNSERWDNSTTLNAEYIKDLKNWMHEQIATHPDVKWRIVFLHKNIYTGGPHQKEKKSRIWRDSIAPLFDELNIDIVFQGHDHIYEVIGPVYNKDTVQASVSQTVNVPFDSIRNVTAKSGGRYNVCKGTLYFLNNASGRKRYQLNAFNSMPDSASCGIPNYSSLFTGRFGQPGNPTYSLVTVSTDFITITTYEIVNKNAEKFDEISVIKNCPRISRTTKQNITIYPNPTTGELTMDNGQLTIDNVEIFDIYGRSLSPQTSYPTPHTSINISHLQAGIYFLKIKTTTGDEVKKVIKY